MDDRPSLFWPERRNLFLRRSAAPWRRALWAVAVIALGAAAAVWLRP